MLAKVVSATILGVEAYRVEVEVDITRGLPSFSTVGLPDGAVKESKDRVKSAVKNSGYTFPARRITVNLAPADVKKEGTGFDLPVAAGILKAEGVIADNILTEYMVIGELSLDGGIKPVRGALPVALSAREAGKKLIVPVENAAEAAIVEGVEVYGVQSLSGLVEFLNGNLEIAPSVFDVEGYFREVPAEGLDFSDVRGQEHVKRAFEVAAAGGHNLIMIGPPGSGKTMLARRLPTILPSMTLEEAIETTKVLSVAGQLEPGRSLAVGRPFRSPHHTISDVGLIGGGRVPRPGEVSLAHNGVLFLDELPEFGKQALEALRQPMEDGRATVTRALMTVAYPSVCMIVGAMNPCPCGFLGDIARECNCTPPQVMNYRGRLSGPLLDRIDIHCDVPAVRFKELSGERSGESSEEIRKRVDRARAVQSRRFEGTGVFSNSRMGPADLRRHCRVGGECTALLQGAVEKLGLSARAYTRVLKVGRTIADLEGSLEINAAHLSEAIQYRTLDRPLAC